MKDIKFFNASFLDLPKEKIKGYVIYCDPPYRNTTKYETEKFPYEKFYDWCVEMAENNVVLISEYNMSEDRFKCIWEKKHKVLIDRNKKNNDNIRIEKLFKVL